MKKILCSVLCLAFILSLCACSKDNGQADNQNPQNSVSVDTSSGDIDVDLTKLSSTMIYSEVSNMVTNPDDYRGKKVKMNGTFAVYEGDNRYYYACLIADATACCSQGLEFVLKDERSYPDEYPSIDSEITVEGLFDTYLENGTEYYQLIDAKLV